MSHLHPFRFIGFALGLTMLASTVTASEGLWNYNGNTVCAVSGMQSNPRVLADGDSFFVIWDDLRNNVLTGSDIFAQRLDWQGRAQWAPNGNTVCDESLDQLNPILVSDGSGGLVACWEDVQNGSVRNIYAQRLNSAGVSQWTQAGISLSPSATNQLDPRAVTDGSGGAVCVWTDYRNSADIYAQRVNGAGSPVWDAFGVSICAIAARTQSDPCVALASSAAAVIAWFDGRVDAAGDIYAQKIDLVTGQPLWEFNGIPVCLLSARQAAPRLVPDGTGGMFVFWEDSRNGASNVDLFAQHLDAQGNTGWAENGLAVCTAAGNQSKVQAVPDGFGNAVLTWEDFRSGAYSDIYAQRISPSGSGLWGPQGLKICDAAYHQSDPQAAPDGTGGAVLVWADGRIDSYLNILAQRVSADGAGLWEPNGSVLCDSSNIQSLPQVAADPAQGFCFAWRDRRTTSGGYEDIFAQRLAKPRPVLTGISPTLVGRGKPAHFEITGKYFLDDRASVEAAGLTRSGESRLAAAAVSAVSGAGLTCDVALTTFTALGAWSPVLIDTWGQTSPGAAAVVTIVPPRLYGLEWLSVPYGYLYSGTHDNLLGQIRVSAYGYDYLQGIRIENAGTAVAGEDITELALWREPEGAGFDPSSSQKIGVFAADGAASWTLSPDRELLPGDSLFLTAALRDTAAVNRTLRLRLPVGGAVFAFGNTLPAAALENVQEKVIKKSILVTADLITLAPVNRSAGQTNVVLADMVLTNVSQEPLTITSWRPDLTGLAGDRLDLSQAFTRLRLEISGASTAELNAPLAPDSSFVLPVSLVLDEQEQAVLRFSADLRPDPAIRTFRFGAIDGMGCNRGQLEISPVTGRSFPLLTAPFHLRGADLASSFHAYPVPFQAGQTDLKIPFFLREPGRVMLEVLTLDRQRVKRILDRDLTEGWQEAQWDGTNEDGHRLVSGVYLLRIKVRFPDGSNEQLVRRVALTR